MINIHASLGRLVNSKQQRWLSFFASSFSQYIKIASELSLLSSGVISMLLVLYSGYSDGLMLAGATHSYFAAGHFASGALMCGSAVVALVVPAVAVPLLVAGSGFSLSNRYVGLREQRWQLQQLQLLQERQCLSDDDVTRLSGASLALSAQRLEKSKADEETSVNIGVLTFIAAVGLALLPELVTLFMFVSAMAMAADGLHLARTIEHKNNYPGLPRLSKASS